MRVALIALALVVLLAACAGRPPAGVSTNQATTSEVLELFDSSPSTISIDTSGQTAAPDPSPFTPAEIEPSTGTTVELAPVLPPPEAPEAQPSPEMSPTPKFGTLSVRADATTSEGGSSPDWIDARPDLIPFPDAKKGWETAIVIGDALSVGAPPSPERFIGVGVMNIGPGPSQELEATLVVNGKEVLTLSIPPLAPAEGYSTYVALEGIVDRLSLGPGAYPFGLQVDPANAIDESDEANNRYSRQMVMAQSPSPVRTPQTSLEFRLRQMIDNHIWVNRSNVREVVALAQQALGDIPIDYARIRLNVLPFVEFNRVYGNVLGKDEQQKSKLARQAATYPEVGMGFVMGSASRQEIVIREGLVEQVFSVLCRELGGAYYAQVNQSGKTKGMASEANELAVTLFEAYAVRLMQEKHGWDGINNVSYAVDTGILTASFNDTGMFGRYIRRLWSLAAEVGYSGREFASSQDFLEWYRYLVTLDDPSTYVTSLDRKAGAIETEKIIANLLWRGLVDKELLPLPDEVQLRADPAGKFGGRLTRDLLLISQARFIYP
ncbi:MAG: hypothetical protein HYY29_01610 [Chloroflexi bacterium]|nr:hypothetical protein [Chloroflexota bacterium]